MISENWIEKDIVEMGSVVIFGTILVFGCCSYGC